MSSLSFNTKNQITNSGFSYDAAGNMISDGVYTYQYDAENRLVSVNNGAVASYTYDANGRRIARRTAAGAVYFFLSDHLGSARVVTNASGTVVEESDFHPFGGERVITDSLDNNYKFTGHERDGETGLDHTWYRKLSSTLGRWTSADPIKGSCANPQSLNRYTYVSNNPTNLVDPTGQVEAFPDISIGFFPGPPPPPEGGCPRFPDVPFFSESPILTPQPPCEPEPADLYRRARGRIAAGVLRRLAAFALKCEGTTDCGYYFRKCFDAKTTTSKAYYCGGAPLVCIGAPTDTYSNCVRLCLQVNDKCFNISDALFAQCQFGLHAFCAAKCGVCRILE